MVDRERNLELLKRRNLTFDKVMGIQMFIGAILGLCFGYLADKGFLGDSNGNGYGIFIGLIVFIIVEAILIETGYVREYAHMLKKEQD
jgi:hypothetical protein